MDYKKQSFAFDFVHCRKYWYKKIFTKLYIQWDYNNVQIKKRDK